MVTVRNYGLPRFKGFTFASEHLSFFGFLWETQCFSQGINGNNFTLISPMSNSHHQ